MKDSAKKLTRGQMVYAPISATQRESRSPFAESKRIRINSRAQNNSFEQQQSLQQSQLQTGISRTQLSPRQDNFAQQQSSIMRNPSSPFVDSQQQAQKLSTQLQQLSKENQMLRSRQQIYVSKLLQLQQGLQRQHEQFMNLQDIYTELFNLYKQKEQEIAELELRYKETERSRVEFGSFSRRDASFSRKDANVSGMSQKMNSIRNNVMEESFRNQLTQLIFQNKRLNETNEKLVSQLNYLKSREKLQDSRQNLNSKIVEELNDWQFQFNQQRQEKIKLQYQNKFFKLRNQDLQKTINDLQKIISMKQNEIIKMREDKINVRRQSSEKVLNRSPPKSTLDSARSKSNHENKKYTKIIENLQKENHRLREQNLHLKQKIKNNPIKSPARLAESSYTKMATSMYGNGSHYFTGMHKKLDFGQSENKFNHDSMKSYQNQNFNSQNTNEQYFSFSRQRDQRQSEEDLPTFPMDLQIQGIIRKHQEYKMEKQTNQNVEEETQIIA